jgi:hypothetical protein
MRSLWRHLALQWLGGEGSETLAGDSGFLDLLSLREHDQRIQAITVRREPAVSHRAMTTCFVGLPEAQFGQDLNDAIQHIS